MSHSHHTNRHFENQSHVRGYTTFIQKDTYITHNIKYSSNEQANSSASASYLQIKPSLSTGLQQECLCIDKIFVSGIIWTANTL